MLAELFLKKPAGRKWDMEAINESITIKQKAATKPVKNHLTV